MADQRRQLLDLYKQFPFHRHPLWVAVFKGALTIQQVIAAEVQHCVRTKAGQVLRREALESASGSSQMFALLLDTYLEECTNDDSGPSHLDLIERLCLMGGRTPQQLAEAKATPGNAAAIALYRDISARGAGCHMLGAGAVEHYYGKLSPMIYAAYVERYGMSPEQAETYRLHGPMDETHAERAFAVLQEAIRLHGWAAIESSVRDAFVATSLHYDGMLQAATQLIAYWDGRS